MVSAVVDRLNWLYNDWRQLGDISSVVAHRTGDASHRSLDDLFSAGVARLNATLHGRPEADRAIGAIAIAISP